MKLPSSLQFLNAGWWAVHVAAIVAVGGAGFVAAAHHGGGHAHGHDAPAPARAEGPATNPVQGEMRVLEAALATAPSRFAAGDLRPLEHALHAVHAAKEKTEAALEKGEYGPARGDKLARFKELDHDFHEELEKLAAHASKNEAAPAAAAYGRVLAKCQGCHAEFRAAR